MAVTRGFQGRRTGADPSRVPPGHVTKDFPVLSAGPTPIRKPPDLSNRT